MTIPTNDPSPAVPPCARTMIDTKELRDFTEAMMNNAVFSKEYFKSKMDAAADELDALRANEQWHRDENDKARKYANELHNENEKLHARVVKIETQLKEKRCQE